MDRANCPTLTDVALVAQVSRDTVSVVLNGSRSNTRVSGATRQRVLDAAAELRYYPNALARGLVRRRMDTLGVLFAAPIQPSIIDNPYAAGLLSGIIGEAALAGLNVTHYTQRWRSAQESAARFRDQRTDGVLVLVPPSGSDVVSALVSLGLAVVVVGTSDQREAHSVDTDNALGARLAVEHLVALGHRRIAHIMGDAHFEHVSVRRDAYLSALMDAGIAPRREYVLPGAYRAPEARANLVHLLRLPEPPTAIFAGNDMLAMWALEQARELGVRIPQDLSIVGFDDVDMASQVTPPLTTVRQPLRELGALATRLLLKQIEGDSEPVSLHVVPPEMVVRSTTCPPARATRPMKGGASA